MTLRQRIHVVRAANADDRLHALQVLKATYREEKNWVKDEAKVFPPEDLRDGQVSWFVVFMDDQPVGVLRVLYDPPLEAYREYGLKQIQPGLDVEDFVRSHRIAEIGRFAVLPEYRKYSVVVVQLMGAASQETVSRGFSHYITDIFEGERHSPYHFHTRVMGFHAVATHDVGELNCPNRRITMILDLKEAYQRLRNSQSWAFRMLTQDWNEEAHKRMQQSNGVAQGTGGEGCASESSCGQ
ncbi:MAG TPA: GNAT family N-acyltransferase [Candidatus Paceibacterota bacterium]|nr:GNAT family N-acyltransferase [Verrucomicrobiota bacterium]HRY47194.1 GNAT family N-acyltransferase [Candidatus Paceibacterota bacterium]HSA03188.1 GNAT family N-acyltransferase [Candidatus Paceibacterota bacterium]